MDITDNLTVSAGGALTSTGAIMVGGNVNFSTTSGDISFGDSGNTIGGTLSASVSTSGSWTTLRLEDNLPNGGLTIGTITLGTGTLELDDFYSAFASVTSPAVSEGTSGGITTATGSVGINVKASNENILLNTAPNSIGGTITVNDGTGLTSGDLALRNTSNAASAANIALSSFAVNNLTLEFDNAPIRIDTTQPVFSAYNSASFSPASLTLIAGGDITETSNGLSVGGTASFTSKGGNVTLDNNPSSAIGNSFSAAISASVSGSHNITLGNTNLITSLGTISLGTRAISRSMISASTASPSLASRRSLMASPCPERRRPPRSTS